MSYRIKVVKNDNEIILKKTISEDFVEETIKELPFGLEVLRAIDELIEEFIVYPNDDLDEEGIGYTYYVDNFQITGEYNYDEDIVGLQILLGSRDVDYDVYVHICWQNKVK